MPRNSKVHRCKEKVERSGKSVGSAIAICQASTGQSLKTGRKIRKKGSR